MRSCRWPRKIQANRPPEKSARFSGPGADGARRPCRVRARADPARTSEGRERAKVKRIRLGRRPKPHQGKEAFARRDAGKPLVKIARSYNVSHSTILQLHTS
ncbi:helix-turn-helix domain-containing protein [Microvirga sp. KLBC 81]|uniref:helix-turn-helix domain-containing protein n=1 Tax=Microvirga sp. KLBC 81 TaxID=1862707 RepID=UPI00352C2F85